MNNFSSKKYHDKIREEQRKRVLAKEEYENYVAELKTRQTIRYAAAICVALLIVMVVMVGAAWLHLT